MSDQRFLQAKAYLQQTDINGNNIYELLVNYINNAKDKEGLDFQTIIQEIIQDSFDKSYFDTKPNAVVVNDDLVKGLESLRKVLRKGRRLRTKEPKPAVSNILEDLAYFGEGGVGITETEAYALQTSINQFVAKRKLRYARFFGLIYGLEKNYYVMETEHCGEQSENDKQITGQTNENEVKVTLGGSEQPAEENKEGTNKFSYWVTNDPAEPFVQLPNVHPAQVVVARQFKKYFTGRLNAPITSYPIFPGTEANLLRVQIGRIAAATTIAPKGVFAIPEKEEEDEDAPKKVVEEPIHDFVSKVDMKPKKGGDDDEEEEESEFEKLSAKALEKLESWVHLYPHIMDTGRVTVYKPPKPPRGDDDEEEEEEEEEGGPGLVERLRSLNMDAGMDKPKFIRPKIVKKKKSEDDEDEEEPEEEEEEDGESGVKAGQQAAWSVRTCNRAAIADSSCISIIKSLRWPGAFAYATANGKKNASVYIGYGFKEVGGLNVFTPRLPPPFQQEMAKVPTQQVDPNVTMINRVYLGQGPPLDEDEVEDDDE